jgi:Protein of unknown function (DUF3288)
MSNTQDQKHPQEASDRATLDTLLSRDTPDHWALAELARLRIRYHQFPGARAIQADLDQLLVKWNLDEAALFAQTRAIHAAAPIYEGRSRKAGVADWGYEIASED